jgi:hypothetical protein
VIAELVETRPRHGWNISGILMICPCSSIPIGTSDDEIEMRQNGPSDWGPCLAIGPELGENRV